MRRAARLALELVEPEWALAPLQALDLPGNLVRRGLGKAWDLSVQLTHAAGRHLAREVAPLVRPLLKPIRAVVQEFARVREAAPAETKIERKVDPVRVRMRR